MKVLIVDDEPLAQQRLQQMLKEHAQVSEVILANNGLQAVESTQENKPDVVLMDIVMPGLNGFQATRQLSKDPSTQHIPVIIVTTKDQETDRVWGKRQGAKGYLVKPVPTARLMEEIAMVMAG